MKRPMLIAEFGHSNSQAPQLVHSEAMIWYAMMSSLISRSCSLWRPIERRQIARTALIWII